MTLNRSQFYASSIIFLIAILKVATLQKEGQPNYIKPLTRTNPLIMYCFKVSVAQRLNCVACLELTR